MRFGKISFARIAVVGLFGLVSGAFVQANENATWASGNSGYWSQANRWSSQSVVPDNVNGRKFDVTINNSSGSVTLDSDRTVQNLTLSSGTLTGSTPTTLRVAEAFKLEGGILSGSLVLKVDGAIHLNAGSLQVEYLEVAPAATMHISSGATSSVINNLGTAYLSGSLRNEGTLTGTFENYGTLVATSTIASVSSVFHNHGLVHVPSGQKLNFFQSKPSYGVVSTGAFRIDAGGSLTFGKTGDLSEASFTGEGNVLFSTDFNGGVGLYNLSGTTTVAGTVAFKAAQLRTLELNAGAVQGDANIHITSDLIWRGGAMEGAGWTYVDAGAVVSTLEGFSNRRLNRVLVNNGTIAWGDSTLSGSGLIVNQSIINVVGKTFTGSSLPAVENTATGRMNIISDSLTFMGGALLSNAGTISLMDSSQLAVNIPSFHNSGRLEITPGSSVSLAQSSLTNSETGVISVTGGTLQLGGTWSNSGSIVATDANVKLGGNFRARDLNNIEAQGTTELSITGTMNNTGNALTISPSSVNHRLEGGTISGGTLEITPGTLFNAYGTIASDTTIGGELTLGAPIGLLHMQERLSLQDSAKITFTLRAAFQGNYDSLLISGLKSAMLDGTLAVEIDPGFESFIQSTDRFTIISSAPALLGEFANVGSGERVNVSNGTGSFLVTYEVHKVVLSDYSPVPEPSVAALAFGGIALLAQRRKRCIRRE